DLAGMGGGLRWIRSYNSQNPDRSILGYGWVIAQRVAVPQDYANAAQWYQKAAEQGNSFAQFQLGSLYFSGRGVARDYGKARQWWEKAAEQKYANAYIDLGLIHAVGLGVPQDYAKAAPWFTKLAELGYPPAYSLLGLMHLAGQGVPRDQKTGCEQLRVSAEWTRTTIEEIRADSRKYAEQSGVPVEEAHHTSDDDIQTMQWHIDLHNDFCIAGKDGISQHDPEKRLREILTKWLKSADN
ncbi:MAG: sel1 repeat family protein, partial [Betaproteobacteria bacterium]|nr:sel1 repeat family protein [Betaproteobacteria bacterium]